MSMLGDAIARANTSSGDLITPFSNLIRYGGDDPAGHCELPESFHERTRALDLSASNLVETIEVKV